MTALVDCQEEYFLCYCGITGHQRDMLRHSEIQFLLFERLFYYKDISIRSKKLAQKNFSRFDRRAAFD